MLSQNNINSVSFMGLALKCAYNTYYYVRFDFNNIWNFDITFRALHSNNERQF